MKNKAIICDTVEQVAEVCEKHLLVFPENQFNFMASQIKEGSQIAVFPNANTWEIMDENFYFESFKAQ
jgi:hypothetical protein